MNISITSGQRKQIVRFVEDGIDSIGLDKDGAQRVIEHGNDLQSAIVAKIRELSVPNRFADEEVKSSYGYLSGYKKPKGITKQTNILRQLFPGIGFADEKLVNQPFPQNAEGWFAIPRWETVASTYGEAVQRALDMIKKTLDNNFYNYREGQLDSKHLRQSQKTVKTFQKLGDEQKGYDILVVPAQFGLLHRGRSVRRALEVMNSNEFGLGAFAIGCMLLTHPERLKDYDDLWIDCAGDEYSGADGQFDHAPCFDFGDGRVRFGTGWVGNASGHCGSASGFLPQQQNLEV